MYLVAVSRMKLLRAISNGTGDRFSGVSSTFEGSIFFVGSFVVVLTSRLDEGCDAQATRPRVSIEVAMRLIILINNKGR